MAEQLQLRSGPYPIAPFAPAQAEVVVDTTYSRLCVGDGIATPGGWAAALETRKAVSDAAYSATGMDRLIAYTAITAARVVTLPAATAYPPGARLMIVDESGACSASNTITVSAAGTDKIDGQASVVINSAYGYIGLESNGSNAWTVIESMSTVAQAPNGASIQFFVTEFLTGTLSGTSYTCLTQLPAPALIFAVGAYVKAAITGLGSPTGFNVGDQALQGDGGAGATRFANGVGLSLGSASVGIASSPFYNWEATNILLAPSGGTSPSFTGGQVRLSIHYAILSPSSS